MVSLHLVLSIFLRHMQFAIVDIETTGSYAAANGITEICIFIHDGKKIVDKMTSLINPYQPVPSYITALTGITNAMVAVAPGFDEVAEKIYQLLHDKIFIAHNVNFDYSFLKHQLGENGYVLNTPKLCTVRLSRKAFPGRYSYSLGNICRDLGIHNESRHRAEGDARATVTLFEKILENDGKKYIDEMLRRTSAEHWIPAQLDRNVIDKLPQKPGVYYFHNAKNKIIYVGKAVNIRKRVVSHFMPTSFGSRRQQFLRFISNITYKECVNELHALVLESLEIKRLWPKYNYAQKQPAQRYGLYSFEDSRGFIRLAIDKRKKHFPSLYNFNLLYEGQTMLRKMIEEFGLHDKLCFMDKSPFEEADMETSGLPQDYNIKVHKAIHTLKESLPTFAVVDKGLSKKETLCLLIEKGNFYGMGYITGNKDLKNLEKLKEALEPATDNDFIRNSIYKYVEEYPEKKITLL